MSVEMKRKGRYTILDFGQKTVDPVDEALIILGNVSKNPQQCILIDFSALKTSKFGIDPSETIERLYRELPDQEMVNYGIAFNDSLTPKASKLARQYDETISQRANYIIVNKNQARMMVNQI